jgi:hypothetical protein
MNSFQMKVKDFVNFYARGKIKCFILLLSSKFLSLQNEKKNGSMKNKK